MPASASGWKIQTGTVTKVADNRILRRTGMFPPKRNVIDATVNN